MSNSGREELRLLAIAMSWTRMQGVMERPKFVMLSKQNHEHDKTCTLLRIEMLILFCTHGNELLLIEFYVQNNVSIIHTLCDSFMSLFFYYIFIYMVISDFEKSFLFCIQSVELCINLCVVG